MLLPMISLLISPPLRDEIKKTRPRVIHSAQLAGNVCPLSTFFCHAIDGLHADRFHRNKMGIACVNTLVLVVKQANKSTSRDGKCLLYVLAVLVCFGTLRLWRLFQRRKQVFQSLFVALRGKRLVRVRRSASTAAGHSTPTASRRSAAAAGHSAAHASPAAASAPRRLQLRNGLLLHICQHGFHRGQFHRRFLLRQFLRRLDFLGNGQQFLCLLRCQSPILHLLQHRQAPYRTRQGRAARRLSASSAASSSACHRTGTSRRATPCAGSSGGRASRRSKRGVEEVASHSPQKQTEHDWGDFRERS